jgi:ribosome-binding factor A
MATHDRAARVAEEFQRALSEILARGLKDPRITGFVTLTGAKMAPDLKSVTVYLSIHGDEPVRQGTLAGLKAAAGYLQREAARKLGLRWVPHLTFHYDGSVAEGDKIERLLRSVRPEPVPAGGAGGGDAGGGGEGGPGGATGKAPGATGGEPGATGGSADGDGTA